MVLSDEIKNKIISILDSDEFRQDLYKDLSKDKRRELGMVYTSSQICIKMLEKFKCTELAGHTILDPACGSGNLLIACLIAGADPDKLYGNELDATAVQLCRARLNRACDILHKPHINDWQIHQGDALDERVLTDFSSTYKHNSKSAVYNLWK